jgi:Nucleotide modification associated domain 3
VNGLLVRVGADLSEGGGHWNGPVDVRSGKFVYVSIPETRPVHAGMEKPYNSLAPALSTFGISLPPHLCARQMHLDPDFQHLTYGDQRERAKQLRANLSADDLIVFYAGLRDIHDRARLVYAIIGLLVVKDFILATSVRARSRHMNAHSRRILSPDAQDLVVLGRAGVSGRLESCLPIGEWRDAAYRVRRDLLDEWGGLSVTDGYLQRSARLPRFLDPPRFHRWLSSTNPVLVQRNN